MFHWIKCHTLTFKSSKQAYFLQILDLQGVRWRLQLKAGKMEFIQFWSQTENRLLVAIDKTQVVKGTGLQLSAVLQDFNVVFYPAEYNIATCP